MRFLDLTSTVYGKLTVLELTNDVSSDRSKIWKCLCICGAICNYPANKLNAGLITQCGNCGRENKVKAGKLALDLKGQRWGRLLVNNRLSQKASDGSFLWSCTCDCGKEVILSASDLNGQRIFSCGCLRSDTMRQIHTTHGMADTPTYRSWIHMRDRVLNEKHVHHDRYGGRGISICENWLNSFEAFYRDMGPRPTEEYSIERIDNNGNYEPGNCYWATALEQARNRSNTIRLTHNGICQSIDTWVEQLKLKKSTVLYRLSLGWTHTEALLGKN